MLYDDLKNNNNNIVFLYAASHFILEHFSKKIRLDKFL